MISCYWWNKETDTVEATDITNWAERFDYGGRVVKQDTIGPYFISTVFLGINHSFGEGPPMIFETMIFFDKGQSYEPKRYSTPSEAREGHARTVLEYQLRTDQDLSENI